jgi:hypothetical protein
VQYACDAFLRLLKEYGIGGGSMSRKGDCWDRGDAIGNRRRGAAFLRQQDLSALTTCPDSPKKNASWHCSPCGLAPTAPLLALHDAQRGLDPGLAMAEYLGDFSKKTIRLLVLSPACRVAQRVT